MNAAPYAEWLTKLGHMESYEEVSVGIESFQSYHEEILTANCNIHYGRSLVIDGEIGQVTKTLLDTPRCSCPDLVRGDGPQEANWPKACRNQLEFHGDLAGLNLGSQDRQQAITAALESWNDVIDCTITETGVFSAADIFAKTGPLNGNTLAWSYLANNSCNARIEQRYNTRTNWSRQYLQAVIAHEVGHALGLGHIQTRGSLMYPYANINIFEPTQFDVEWAVQNGYTDTRGEEPEPEPDDGWREAVDRITADTNKALQAIVRAIEDNML